MFKSIFFIILLSALALADGSMLKTGQTKSYDADGNVVTDGSIKDDGYYQAGKARSYTRSNEGIVKDNVTGLEWQDNVDSVMKPWLTEDNYVKCTGQNGETPDESKCTDTSGDTAATYCSSLELDGGTWRLPTMLELETVVDVSHYDPSVTTNTFQHMTSDWYWSSTTRGPYDVYNDNAWSMNFYGGMSGTDPKDRSSYVLCVRGRELEPSSFTRDNGTGIVTDGKTGLQWQDRYNDNNGEIKLSIWTDAIDYCEASTLGGKNDWRLPNIYELTTTIDWSRQDPASNPIFQYANSTLYWSSSTLASYARDAWIVNFFSATIRSISKGGDSFSVRCVRGGQIETLSTIDPGIIMYLLN